MNRKSNGYAPPFRSYSSFLLDRFGEKVWRIPLDAGLGCPHRKEGRGTGGCIFCNAEGSGSGAFDRGISVREQMASGIARLSRRGIRKYLAYFQAFCGTNAGRAELRRLYLEAVDFPGVVGLSIGTRPDLVPDEVLDLLAALAGGEGKAPPLDVWLELGLQSADDDTLKRIRRGHDRACFDAAVERASRAGLSVAAHVILGLPGEDRDRMMATADHLSLLPVKGVKLHHLFVERGTELAQCLARGEAGVLSLDDYVELAIGFLRRLRRDMVIMRLAGGADPERLVAPRWDLNASALVQRIEGEMIRRGVGQGDLAGG